MTELEMLKHLLRKSGRTFDECTNTNGTVSIQIHFNDSRWQWDFEADGTLIEEWENPHESQWISEQWRFYN